MVDLWELTNVSGVPEWHPAFIFCPMWVTERCEVAELEVVLALCNVAAILGSRESCPAAAGEILELESLQRGIFVAELLEDELGAIFRGGCIAEGFDVWPPTLNLFVGLSMHSTTQMTLSCCKTLQDKIIAYNKPLK